MSALSSRRWLLLLDAVVLALVLLMLVVEDAGQLFKLIFFVLTIGTFFWDLSAFVVRGAFWVSLTTVVLLGSVWAGRVPALELLDVPFFLAVLVLVFAINSRRAEAKAEVERLLSAERERARRLADLAELKADFTAMVVHEFGNPISALRRLNEMLRFEGLDGEARTSGWRPGRWRSGICSGRPGRTGARWPGSAPSRWTGTASPKTTGSWPIPSGSGRSCGT